MTTVICDRRGMAADMRLSDAGIPAFKTTKIHRINGSLIGFCGNAEQALQFIEWRRNPGPKPTFTEACFEALELNAAGEMFWWGSELQAVPVADEVMGIGSGAAYAIGAVAMGASLKRAIQIASQYDSATGAEVQTMTLGGKS